MLIPKNFNPGPQGLFLSIMMILSFQPIAEARVGVSNFNVNDMRYPDACAPAQSQITIGGVGDLLMHSPVQQTAVAKGSYRALWNSVMPVLNQAHILYANLETPLAPGITKGLSQTKDPGFAFDNRVYTSYPQFNVPARLASDLVQSGFDVVSTSNNHSLDRGAIGADLTIETLRNAGMPYTGTRHSAEGAQNFYTSLTQNGWKIAFLGCTFSTNGIPDRKDQVLNCFGDKSYILKTVTALARSHDAVIVTPHWGVEYVHDPENENVALGRELIEAGATAVIATHPHVVQPWEKYAARDGRLGLIAYSTGNFISNQSQWQRRLGLSVFVGLSKGRDGRVWINGVRYHPLWTGFKPARVESLPRSSDVKQVWNLLSRLLGEDRYLPENKKLVTNYECFN